MAPLRVAQRCIVRDLFMGLVNRRETKDVVGSHSTNKLIYKQARKYIYICNICIGKYETLYFLFESISCELLFMDPSEINCFKRRMKVMPVAEGGAINFSPNLPRFSLNFVESIFQHRISCEISYF